MSGILQPLTDVITRIQTSMPQLLMVRVWNNQIRFLRERKEEAIPFPCAFVEIQAPQEYTQLGMGFHEAPIVFSIHLVHEFYDAMDGTLEQDLAIFALRDQCIRYLTGYQPTACSVLFMISESQQFDHDNLYEYVIQFKCSFIDSKGSPLDVGRPEYISSTPPTLEQVTVSQGIPAYVKDNSIYRI